LYAKFTQEEWDDFIKAHPLGSEVNGTVIHTAVFGSFVEVDELPGVKALLELIHFEILVNDPDHSINYPDDYPKIGDRITARILAWSMKPLDVRLTQLNHLD
jgi:predicted RNA-binding protein with RPS1 domain